MTPLPPELKSAIVDLVSDIVAGRYAEIASGGRIGRLTADELAEAVRLYGRTLIPLPDDAWSFVHVYPINGDARALSLDVEMFTIEEGRSDLTLSLSARRDGDRWTIGIDDLHVL